MLKITSMRLLLFVCLLLLIRLTCSVVLYPTGLQTALQHFAVVAEDLLGLIRTPVVFELPAGQAKYWQEEASKIRKSKDMHAHAMEQMGLALILDTPSQGFWMTPASFGEGVLGFHPKVRDLSNEQFDYEMTEFERICGTTSFKLALESARHLPDNVELWRLCATLLVSSNTGDSITVRDPNWRSVLAECSRHDPENALYDYIGTYILLNGGYNLSTIANSQINEGLQRLDRGREQPQFFVGYHGKATILRVLRQHSNLDFEFPPSNHGFVIASRHIDQMFDPVSQAVQRYSEFLVDKGDHNRAFTYYDRALEVLDQVPQDQLSLTSRAQLLRRKWQIAKDRSDAVIKFPDTLSSDRIDNIQRELGKTKLDWEAAAVEIENGQSTDGSSTPHNLADRYEVIALVASVLPFAIVTCGAIGGILLTLNRLSSGSWDIGNGHLISNYVILIGIAVYLVLLTGILPAGICNSHVSFWLLHTLVIAAICWPLVIIVQMWARKQFSISRILLLVFATSVACVVVFSNSTLRSPTGNGQPGIWLTCEPCTWRHLRSMEEIEAVRKEAPARLVALQLMGHSGVYAILGCWTIISLLRRETDSFSSCQAQSKGEAIGEHLKSGESIRMAAREILLVGFACAVCYLTVAPFVIEAVSSHYNRQFV